MSIKSSNINIVATSSSFSKHPKLVETVTTLFPKIKLNSEGKRFTKNELIEYIGDAEAVIVGLDTIDADVLDNCPNIKIIAKYGVGLNNLDIPVIEERGIKIGWTGGVNRLSVAEMTLGYMLMLCRNLYLTSNLLKQGTWKKAGGFQLSGKTIGVIGVGFIGKEVIRLLQPFGCKIWVNDIINQDEYYQSNGLIEKTKEEIYQGADIITIHTPYDDTTANLINEKVFVQMKTSSIVLNSARGGIINENDLKHALLNGEIAGAAIDAYAIEPPEDTELIQIPSLITTPHIGGNSVEAVEAMGMSAIQHVKRFYQV